jgi:hypothetical protein
MDLDLFGFVMAYGGFTLFKGQMDVNDGSYDAAAQTGIKPFKADLLSISFEQVSLFAGAGGEFTRAEDSNPNDNIDPPATGFNRNNGAVGFYVSNANLWLAVLKSQEPTDPAKTYVGLEFSVDGVGLEGIQGLALNVFDCSLMVNWASDGNRLDWTTATINDDTHDQYERLADFEQLTGALEFLIRGALDLSIYGYVVAVGSFEMVKQDVSGIDDPDDSGALEISGSLFTIDVSVEKLFAGTGAVMTGGNLDTSHATGFLVTGGTFDLAVLTTDETTPRTYTGLETSLGSGCAWPE